MKEQGIDGQEFGFKAAADGWHLVEVEEGIDFLKAKGGESVWQDKDGSKAYVFPMKVKDSDDPDDGANIGCTVFIKSGGNLLASILVAAGLWDAVQKKFPGDDVSVFDEPVMNGIKSKLPGIPFYVESKQDKGGFPKVNRVASAKKYKEILAEEKAKAAAKKASGSGGSASTEKSAAPVEQGDNW